EVSQILTYQAVLTAGGQRARGDDEDGGLVGAPRNCHWDELPPEVPAGVAAVDGADANSGTIKAANVDGLVELHGEASVGADRLPVLHAGIDHIRRIEIRSRHGG